MPYQQFRPYQKQIIQKYRNNSYSQQTRRIQKWPTKLRKKLSSSKVRGRQRKYKINLHGNLSLIKQQQLYWFAKNLFFFSHPMKDNGEASSLETSAEPIKVTQQPWNVCWDNPNTNKQAICRQCSKTSCWGRSKKSTSCSAVLLNQWQKQPQQIDIKM